MRRERAPADSGPEGHDFGAHGRFDAQAHERSPQAWASRHHTVAQEEQRNGPGQECACPPPGIPMDFSRGQVGTPQN